MVESREAPFGHEPPGVDTRRVVGIVLGMGVLIAIALVAIYLALAYWIMPDYVQLHTQSGLVPPAPRLQPTNPHHDLDELRAEKAALLSGYAWTGKSHEFARIPIQRAMQMEVREHASAPQKRETGNRERGTADGEWEGERNRGHEDGAAAVAGSVGRNP